MTIRECQARMDASEFFEWIAYDRLDPIGGERLDALMAQQAFVTARAAGAKNVRPDMFLPDWGPKASGTLERADLLWSILAGGQPRTKAKMEAWIAAGKPKRYPGDEYE